MLASQTRLLLDVSRAKFATRGEFSRLVPPGVAVLNLFACAAIEGQIRSDSTGHAHALLYLCEGLMYIALSIGYFSRSSFGLLDKCRVFPLTAPSRFWFAIVANVRRPIILGLVASSAFFLIVVHRHDAALLMVSLVGLMLIFFSLEMTVATLCLTLSRTPYPGAAGLGTATLYVVGVLCASLLQPGGDLLGAIPPVCWVATAVREAGAGTGVSVLSNLVLAALWGTGAAAIGLRYS
jgi:hypothetical protein